MYIKYLDEIHNVTNYYSILRNAFDGSTVQLSKENGNYQALKFKDEKARDFALAEIWKELKKKTLFFDLDEIIKIYYVTNKYNV